MAAQPPLPVLLTRPRAQSDRFAKDLPANLAPVISPLLEIVPLKGFAAAPPGTTLIFTSGNGVHAYAAQFPGDGQQALCVGDRTAVLAHDAGFETISAGGDADALVAMAQTMAGPFVHVRGVHVTGDVAARLRALGKEVDERVAYDQATLPLSDAALNTLKGPCLVPLFSPRTAELFAKACPSAAQAHIMAMSPSVASRLPQNAYKAISVLKTPNAAAMRDALSAYASGNHLEARGSSS